ncbi:MAG: sugar ABC transporter substrate-binding protein [Acidimicrobiia bacterium]
MSAKPRFGIMSMALVLVLGACGGSPTAGTQAPGATAAPGTDTTSAAVGEGAAQAKLECSNLAYGGDGPANIAYMPPATEFPYYIAIGEGLKAKAAELGHETFMLAPQSGADIAGQMGMIQDVLTQDVDAIILSTHDEQAAAPLVKQATDAGVAVVIVNSDIADFPTPVHGVVGYQQRAGTHKIGDYAIELVGGEAKVGIIEGLPGYHSTERIGGFLDAIADQPGMEVVASLPGNWNVEGGNQAGRDLLQANPEVEMIMTANDYMSIGANIAAKELGRDDVVILGNDGDTQALEEIAAGEWQATVNTTPYLMGEAVMEVTDGCLKGAFDGFYVETPTVIVDETNVMEYICQPDTLYPPLSKDYDC